MTVFEYLLLGGLLAAGIYTIGRLFVGWVRTARSKPGPETGDDVAGFATVFKDPLVNLIPVQAQVRARFHAGSRNP